MGLFWSYRTTKIPSSPSKPVPRGSKIVGKTEREKRAKVRIMTDLWSFSITSALATWTIIFMTASSPCEQKHTLGCPPFLFHIQNNSTSSPGLLGNGTLTCSGLHFWRHFLVKHKILPNLVIPNWLWWIMHVLLANQNWGNILNEIITHFNQLIAWGSDLFVAS